LVVVPPTATHRWRDVVAGTFIVLFLLPHVATLVLPYEEYPYTSAPMFAHYVGEDTPLYRIRLVAERADGSEREIHATDFGLNGVEFTRQFFGAIYGSIDPYSPFGHHGDETRDEFERRLSDFFPRLVTALERRSPGMLEQVPQIRVDVARLDASNREALVHVVGRYSIASRHFTHTWGRGP